MRNYVQNVLYVKIVIFLASYIAPAAVYLKPKQLP